MDFTKSQKHLIIRLLLEAAGADQDFQMQEKTYIQHVSRQIGLDVQKLTEDDLKNAEYPEDERERMTILYYLLFLIRSDQEISPAEEDVVKVAGLQLGFRPAMVHQMIDILKNFLDEFIPPHKLIESIKPFLN